MSFHLAAYFYHDDSSPENASRQLPPVTDMFLPSTADGFLLPFPMKIVAAYASSSDTLSHSYFSRAAITAPSLRRVAYPYIRPISHNLPEKTDPNVMNLVAHPIALPASESVGVLANIGYMMEPFAACALLWLCDELVPVPPGEAFVLRFQATSSAMTVGRWSPVGSITFDQSLPPGAYTVIGFEHKCANAIAARLIFPGSHMRPGTLSMGGEGDEWTDRRTHPLFYEGGLGCYGTFNAFAPPSLEVLANYPDTEHEGYLTVIRTGDAGEHPQVGSPIAATSSAQLR